MKTGGKVVLGIGGGLFATFVTVTVVKAQKRPPPIEPEYIVLSDLAISPEVVNPGQTVTISVVATNIGGETGIYTVILGGDFVAQKTVTLGPGESKPVSFTVRPTEAKVYLVSVDGLAGAFIATELPVADIRVEDLVIEPASVYVGEVVTISVLVTNYGAAPGSKTITFTVT